MSCFGLQLTCKQKPEWMQIVTQNDVSRSQYEREITRLDAQNERLRAENARLQAEVQQLRAVAVSPYFTNVHPQNPRYRQWTWKEVAYLRKENEESDKALLKKWMSTAVGFIREARAKLRSFTRREEQLAPIESTLCKAERFLDCE